MAVPIVYDMTYVAARLHAATPTGIERVDAAYARHFALNAADDPTVAAAVHYGLQHPHTWTAARARRLVERADSAWRGDTGLAGDAVFQALAVWLATPAPPPLRATAPRPSPLTRLRHAVARVGWRLADDRGARIPQGAIYLNVAQYAFEYPLFFRWLERRRDVRPVFFVHDLLPLDVPEFFRTGYRALFERRVRTAARFARAVIVSSAVVEARLRREMDARGRRDMPILVAALPPPALAGEPVAAAAVPPGTPPYFVVVGTIEPRKNHLLLLNVWRDLARAGGAVPRLVLVGPRGWDNEQVLDLLDRSPLLAPHVAEVAGLTAPGLRHIVAGARALLMPSFEEGYGLPLAEALAAGTPAIASDIPVFREVSQGRARMIDATDGPAWRRAVVEIAAADGGARHMLCREIAGYAAPSWPDHFSVVGTFLDGLSPRPSEIAG